jgi:CBS domain-containing protein
MKLEFVVPKGTNDRVAYLDGHFTLAGLMQAPALSLTPAVGIGEAAERMIEAGVHAVPIVDEADHVLGIVTTSDVMRCLLHGPPRRGTISPAKPPSKSAPEDGEQETHYHLKPTAQEYATALSTAETLHVESRDLRFLGKTLLYLDQRRAYLEKVFELADRFLVAGQSEHVHSLLLKAILAVKRAEEHATGAARVPFPLE